VDALKSGSPSDRIERDYHALGGAGASKWLEKATPEENPCIRTLPVSEPAIRTEPSRFWATLGSQHAAELHEHGFDQIKRRQALRYFTWQWQLERLRRSEQLRFLLARTSIRQWMRCAGSKMDLAPALWRGVNWSRTERWIYTAVVRLLWEYASARGSQRVLELQEPPIGDPLPVYWQGRLISQDLANGALEAAAIERAVSGRPHPRSIFEIGAGYGRTAYVLLHLFPEATYTICDIEPALSISRWYLTHLFPAERLRFLSPAEAVELRSGSLDLAVSISSLHEMTKDQIASYVSLLDRVTTGGVVYLKQWVSWSNPVDHITTRFSEYPIPVRWQTIFNERAPVQTNFQQAAWFVR
jgi:putative sugar O-methyltransferase